MMSILTVRKYQNIICFTVERDNRDEKEATIEGQISVDCKMEHCPDWIWNRRIKESKRLRKSEIGRRRNAAVNTSGANLQICTTFSRSTSKKGKSSSKAGKRWQKPRIG